jgi:hypothetical protein
MPLMMVDLKICSLALASLVVQILLSMQHHIFKCYLKKAKLNTMLGMLNLDRSIFGCEGTIINRHGAWATPFIIECKWSK